MSVGEEGERLALKRGAMFLQGPHHVAVKSTTTSLSPASLRVAKKVSYCKRKQNNVINGFFLMADCVLNHTDMLLVLRLYNSIHHSNRTVAY